MANTPADTSRVTVDVALIVTGCLLAFMEVLRVVVLVNTGHDDPTLVSLVNTLIVPFVGIITADRLGNVISKVKNGSGK